MKITVKAVAAALALAVLTSTNSAFAQGSLTPPVGAPAPVMKSLAQVEPRTPINATTTPGNGTATYVIAQPGSYFLEGNIAVSTTNGISVTTNDVTIDLRGFTISRATGTNGSAIQVSAANCAIRSGNVRGFAIGIDGQSASAGLVQGVTVMGFGIYGYIVRDAWRFSDCAALNATNAAVNMFGFSALTFARFDRCQAAFLSGPSCYGFSAGSRSTFNSCGAGNLTATFSSSYGFSTETDCGLYSCQANGNNAVMGGFGFSPAAGSLLKDCIANNNVVSAGTGSSGGFWTDDGVTMIDCMAENNSGASNLAGRGGMGIFVYGAGLIQNCTVRANSGDGIHVGGAIVSGVKIINNVAVDNTQSGIRMGNGSDNVFERNYVRGNGIGLNIVTAGNLILGNTAAVNGTNYVIALSNRYGPIVDLTAAGAAAVSGNSAASTLGTTDPQANLAY
ncbi:MAG: right-handed parallel beta-helix repeat-containing protein [Pedosphaera sp.]|nr:right-handed parallel beta-helix repeat-containing protein [Pedosphaera sp.]